MRIKTWCAVVAMASASTLSLFAWLGANGYDLDKAVTGGIPFPSNGAQAMWD